MKDYIPIKTETLTGFANNARRLGAVETELSTDEMLGIFANAPTIQNQDITVTASGVYTADSEYTGLGTVTVEIPEIPANARLYYIGTAKNTMNLTDLRFGSNAVGTLTE